MRKKITSVEVNKIKNGWLVEMNWQKGKGDKIEYNSDKTACGAMEEASEIVKGILPNLQE